MKKVESYPNGIRMRFVKLKKDSINAEERSKLDKLRHRQVEFLKNIDKHTNYKILQLDYSPNAGVIPTLRQMIMGLTSTGNWQMPIFHSVDMDWQQDGFVFQYSKKLADEAETVLNGLLPLLKHHYPQADVGSNFSCDAEVRCATLAYIGIQKKKWLLTPPMPQRRLYLKREKN